MIQLPREQSGFSAVELLITLFIAFMFVVMGYQLYSVAIKESGDSRMRAQASNLAYKYLREQSAMYATGTNIRGISAGIAHSIALASDGKTIYSWGSNMFGSVGDGGSTESHRSVPVTVDVSGTPLAGKTITAIAAGGAFTLALTSEGRVYSWGHNLYGQLGNGTSTMSQNKPVAVSTTSPSSLAGKTVKAIAAGPLHSLAIATDGTVHAWGSNATGELGDGTSTYRNQPVAVSTTGTPMAGKNITAIAAGGIADEYSVYYGGGWAHSLAFDEQGNVYSWGANYNGQLGDGTNTSRNKPVAVSTTGTPMAGKSVIAIAAGDSHSLAVGSDNKVYAWGIRSEIGIETTTDRNKPVAVSAEDTPMAGKVITKVATKGYHSLALDSSGRVYSWGYNGWGQLGDGTTTDRNKPVAVSAEDTPMAGKNITDISSAYYQSFALASDGSMYTWGYGDMGLLGNGSFTARHKPASVSTTPPSALAKTSTCTPSQVLGQNISAAGIRNGKLDIITSCPSGLPVTQITVKIRYGTSSPQQEVVHAMYAG